MDKSLAPSRSWLVSRISGFMTSGTIPSWYMVNRAILFELAKILGHANVKMTERYARLAGSHIARIGSTARQVWRLIIMDGERPLLSC